MPRYRTYRMKDMPRESFRWAPHTGGEVVVKVKDYEVGRVIEAATPYAAWKYLNDEGQPLGPGDLLQILRDDEELASEITPDPAAVLLIAKYIGFEPAKWFIPEPKRPESRADLAPIVSSTPTSGAAQSTDGAS